MASTIAFYTGDGTTTDFTVPFDYLAKKFVRVSLGVTILKGGDYGDTSKDYYFLDKTKVRLKVPPQVGEVLTIRRYTSATDRVVSFKDASVLKATDLDVSSVQTIHIAEESRDIINDALIKGKGGNWDAKGNRIVNVGTPEADSDAVPYGVYKADALGAYQSKLDAERARDRAIEAETNSKKSEANSKLSEENAQASADTAVSASEHADAVKVENQAILQEAKEIRDENKVLDTNTKNNANVAQVKANEAKVSETNAKASEVEAKKQADLAKGYANQASSGQVNADWNETVSTSKAFIKNKPTLGALASKDSIAYSEITGTPPEQDLSGLATKNELQEAINNVSSKVDGIGDTLSPTYAKKQTILDACDQAMNGANPVHAGDPALDDIKSALATIQAQLGQLENRRYVKETGKSSDGNSWYRKWSDGWIEQGGTLKPSSANSESFSFPVEMKNANFSIFGSHVGTTSSVYAVIFTDLTTASAKCKSGVSGYAIKWYVCGY